MSRTVRYPHLAVIILLLAWALRLFHLNARPLWYDEAFAVLFSEKGVRAMLYGTLTPVAGAAADVHPIVYYAALGGWMRLAGQSPLTVRLPSALVGLLTVALAFALARRWWGKPAGVAAALLVTFSPFHVYYSREARMYAPLALWLMLVVWFYVGGKRNLGGRRQWVGVSLAAALALYTQNLAAFFLLALGLLSLTQPRRFIRLAVAGGGALVIYLPWLLNVPSQFAKLRQAYWVTRPTAATLLQTGAIWHTGEEFVASGGPLLALALFPAILLPVLMLYRIARRWRVPESGARAAGWAFTLAMLGPALMFAASQWQPVYLQRALLPSALVYCLPIAWLLTRGELPRPVTLFLAGTLGTAFALGLAVHYSVTQFPRSSFLEADEFLRRNAAPGDVILHSNKLTFFPMHYYDRSLPQAFVADPPGSGSDTLAEPTQRALGLYALADLETATAGKERIWFVIFDRAIDEYQTVGQPTHPHLALLEAILRQRGVIRFNDLLVYEFSR